MGSPPLLKFCPQLAHDDEREGQKMRFRRPFPSPVTKAENFQLVAVFHLGFYTQRHVAWFKKWEKLFRKYPFYI